MIGDYILISTRSSVIRCSIDAIMTPESKYNILVS